MSLDGTSVLITGGRRVGTELARLLTGQGAAVALTYHTSREATERTVASLQAGGGRALAVPADLTQPEQAAEAVTQTVAAFGRIDALVNMASTYLRTPFATLTPADYNAMIAANLTGPYHAAVAAARRMLTQDDRDGLKGKIVNIGDWATERPYKHYLPYLIAKGGLTTMTLALAKELAPHVAVNMIQPAMIAPPPEFSQADRDAVVAQTPLRRVGRPDDVNRLILYLLDGTNFATGACFRVDGGRFLGPDE